MSAAEIATVVEGWATLAGLMVVIAGATFAGVQLRRDSRSRRLQAIMDVLRDVRSREVADDWEVMSKLPDGFDPQELSAEERLAVRRVQGSYIQLGNLLAGGFLREQDIFSFLGITRVGIESWEKAKHIPRTNEERGGVLPVMMFHEYFAARAEAYLDRQGLKEFGKIPRFDSNSAVMNRVAQEVSEARSAA